MKTFPTLVVSLLASSLLLTGCSATSNSSSLEVPSETTVAANTNPQDGWVLIVDKYNEDLFVSVYKRCDGSKMIYVTPGNRSGAHGISVVLDDPECVG